MKRLLILATISLAVAGCYNDKYDKLYPVSADPCDTTNKTVSYAATVSGILVANCATTGCHDAASSQGGYDLSSYTGVHTAAITNNVLLGDIQHLSGYNPMPKSGGSLSACQIAQITKWVNQGSPNN